MTGRRWLAVASIAGACVLLLSVSCGGGEKTVTGFVLEVVERNLVEIELLRVRTGPVGSGSSPLRETLE